MDTVAQIEFLWSGYVPETAIRRNEDTPVASYTLRQGAQLDPPGQTLGDVYDWMWRNDLAVAHSERVYQPKRGGERRWTARYRLIFAPKKELADALPAPF
jgi:hypothetical protein